MASAPYKLSAILYGHSMDVRALAVTNDNCIVSASRDKTAKLWKPNQINSGYTDTITFKGHSHFVSSLCLLPPSEKHPQELIVTGGNDKLICIFTQDNPTPVNVLKGHTDTVCSLSSGIKSGYLLSSSWDKTAKLWNVFTGRVEQTFEGHQAAVWAVIQLRNENIITGSADKNIIIWDKDGSQIRTLSGHTDCVRGLAILNDEIFISIANDAQVKQWTVQGDCINTFFGHTNYIYSICLDKSSTDVAFITSGEDSTVRYWEAGENTQTISLPSQSVWCVASLSNGDIVTGTNDGVIRIFTQHPDRVAEQAVLKTYEEEVNNAVAASTQEIGGVKVTDLPGREVLYEPGRSDGQTKLIREGTTVQCYSWSEAEGQWKKVGDVLGAAGGTQESSGKTLYEGKEYDFVFSVDIEDGKPALKLPYNRSEDPWFAAQTFIHKNNLSQMFLDQVANFIITNSGGSAPPPSNTPGFVDPFTGGSRYIPGSSTGPAPNAGSNADPFTGSSSYTSNLRQQNTNSVPTIPNADPFTGSSSYTTKTNQQTMFAPQRTYLRFEQANLSAIYNKLKEFNCKVDGSSEKVDENVLEDLIQLASEGDSNASTVNTLLKLLSWPSDTVFPVLDIIRLAIRHRKVNEQLCTKGNSDRLVQMLQTYTSNECTITSNQMLALRIISNMFTNTSGEELALKNKEQFISNIVTLGPNLNKNIQTALSTVILNYCIAFHKKKDFKGLEMIVDALTTLIPQITEPEAHFRLLVTTGTLICDSSPLIKPQIISKLNADYEFKTKISDICNLSNAGEINDPALAKMVSCAHQINNLLTIH